MLPGIDILGALPPARLIQVRIDNAAQLAERESALAGAVGRFAPETIDQMVYEEIAKQIDKALRDKGAKVSVTVAAGLAPAVVGATGFWRDVLVTVVGGIGALILGGFVARRRT